MKRTTVELTYMPDDPNGVVDLEAERKVVEAIAARCQEIDEDNPTAHLAEALEEYNLSGGAYMGELVTIDGYDKNVRLVARNRLN